MGDHRTKDAVNSSLLLPFTMAPSISILNTFSILYFSFFFCWKTLKEIMLKWCACLFRGHSTQRHTHTLLWVFNESHVRPQMKALQVIDNLLTSYWTWVCRLTCSQD